MAAGVPKLGHSDRSGKDKIEKVLFGGEIEFFESPFRRIVLRIER